MSKWTLLFLVLFAFTICSQQQGQGQDNQAQMQYISMRRTACLVLSRYHSNTQKDTIEGIVQGLTQQHQQKYINRIYSVAVQKCEPLITQSEVQELFVQNTQFEPSHLFYLFEAVNYEELADNLQAPLTKSQQAIVKFMKNFDQQMAIRREQKQAEKAESGDVPKTDIKILGISLGQLSSFTKFLYTFIFVSIVGGALFWGFRKLDEKPQKKQKRRKASPKKD